MTGMISIQVVDDEVMAVLHRLMARAADATPAMRDIAQALESETEHNFEAESGPGGDWQALAPSTIAARVKAGTWPGRILQIHAGGLAASVASRHGKDFAEIGSNKVYAAIHHLGGKAGRGNKATIPARSYLPIGPDGKLQASAAETILEILGIYLDLARST